MRLLHVVPALGARTGWSAAPIVDTSLAFAAKGAYATIRAIDGTSSASDVTGFLTSTDDEWNGRPVDPCEEVRPRERMGSVRRRLDAERRKSLSTSTEDRKPACAG